MGMKIPGLGVLQQARALARTKRFAGLPEVALNFVRYNWVLPRRTSPSLPRALLIYVTYRCNARCAMCGIWQEHDFSDARCELTLRELEGILSDRLFAEIEYLNINGGEPTLRADLADVVRLSLAKLPNLKHLSLNSNGLLTGRLVSAVGAILSECGRRRLPFSLVLSMHDTDQRLDEILGVPGAARRQQAALAALQALDGREALSLSINCVITNLNAARLEAVHAWCVERGLRINFILGEVRDRFFNQAMTDRTVVSGEQKQQAIAFLRRLARGKSLADPATFRYHELANMLEWGTRRRIACHYAMGGLILGSYGDLYYCSHSRAMGNCRRGSAYSIYFDAANLRYRQDGLLQAECAHCPPNTFNRLEFQKDMLRFLTFLARPNR